MYCAGMVTSGVNVESSPLSHRALISYFFGALGSYPGADGLLTSARRHSIAANVPVVSVKLLEWKRTASAGEAAGPGEVRVGKAGGPVEVSVGLAGIAESDASPSSTPSRVTT